MRYSVLLLLVVFVACNNGTGGNDMEVDTIVEMMPPETDTAVGDYDNLIWSSSFDTAKNNFVLHQNRQVNKDTLTPQNLISEINLIWDSVQLNFEKISHDTLFVSIPHSSYLTERMGTSGADSYMSSTTYNLTELKNITFVHYDFKQGDHLSPGTMSRDDFKEYTK